MQGTDVEEGALQRSLFGADQEPLPGMAYVQTPLMAAVRDLEEWPLHPVPEPAHPGPGQLSFGANQLELTDAEPQPIQMSLIEDPAPWETHSAPSKKRPRRPSKKNKAPAHDQLPLF